MVIAQSFNRPTTNLITTPIRRVTADGVETIDGVRRPVDLIVLATGYELFTDPETYRVGTIIGRNGFDLAEDYHRNGLRAYAGSSHPELPNRWGLVGPYGYAGFAWFDAVETAAAHAVRLIDEARGGGFHLVSANPGAFAKWNARMIRRGRPEHLYITAVRPGVRSYFLNSQGETVYHRPQTIAAARRFARRSPLSDYQFSNATADAVAAEKGAATVTTTEYSLSGKVAYVTGAARGQGRSHCLRLARGRRHRRHRRVQTDRQAQHLSAVDTEDLAETIRVVRGRKARARLLLHDTDVRDLTGQQNVIDDAIEHFGRLDIVVATQQS